MHSWRVLILPQLGEQALYDQYRFDEPWNGPNNRKLLAKMPRCYACPSYEHHAEDQPDEHHASAGEYFANYVLITGPGTVFPVDETGASSVTDADIEDKTQTVVLMDANIASVPWMAPRDIDVEEFVRLEDEANHEPDLFVVGFVDGHIRIIPDGLAQTQLESWATSAMDRMAGE